MRLASEEDLYQLRLWDLEVGKHSHGFQDGVVKVLRFINHYDEASTCAEFAQQNPIQLTFHSNEVIFPVTDSEVGHQGAQKSMRVALRLHQEGRAGGVSQGLQEVKEQSRFAHPWLCNQGHESTPSLDPVIQGCQRFKMRGTEIEKTWIGRNPERLLA